MQTAVESMTSRLNQVTRDLQAPPDLQVPFWLLRASLSDLEQYLNGYNDDGQTINYPVPFTYTPKIITNSTSVSTTTSQLTIQNTGGQKTGWIIVEGY